MIDVWLYEMYVPNDKKIIIKQQSFGGFSNSAFWKHYATDNHIRVPTRVCESLKAF